MTRLPHLVVLVAIALGSSACSDDADPAPTSAPSSMSTTDATSEPTTPPATTVPTAVVPPSPTPSATVPAPPPPPAPPAPPVDPDALPATYDAAQARFDALGQEPQELTRFETAGGIYCLLDSDFAIGCELPQGGIPDPDYCGDGPSQNIGRITFGAGDPTPECNSDTIREPGAPALAQGSVGASAATGIRCLVEAVGVTCLDPARTRGFFLGPDAYTVFTAG